MDDDDRSGHMTDTHEVELKFTCVAADLAAVLAAAPAGDDDNAELISVYFDTPDLALQKAGASLRVREAQGRRVQTLKRGEGMAREEHEAAIDGLAPDPQLGPLPKLMPPGADLKPAFNVRVSRRQRRLHFEGAEIELALDQGEVVSGKSKTPICEVELELRSGPREALFSLSRVLLEAAPLYLSFDSKASRGQALAAGGTETARAAEPVELSGDETVAGAFQAVARKALAQIAANAAILRTAPSAEAVHQLRVGARRLRSAVTTFGAALKGDGLAAVKDELKWLGKACDQARNLDVFADSLSDVRPSETESLGVAALRKAVSVARRKARASVIETVGSPRFCRLMVDVTAWVETGAWRANAAAMAGVEGFADEALKHRRRKVLQRAQGMGDADDHDLHRLRIAAKKLRYAGDAFASLYRRKRAEAFEDRVKDLQTELGELNDLATAGPLVQGLGLPSLAAFAAGELLGQRLTERPRRVRRAAKALRALKHARPFWA
jgi:inorganic triphosphatase YgiF